MIVRKKFEVPFAVVRAMDIAHRNEVHALRRIIADLEVHYGKQSAAIEAMRKVFMEKLG